MMKWMIVTAACLMIASPALAGHEEPHNPWMTLQWDMWDESILYCNALGEVSLGFGLYLVQRELPNGENIDGGPLGGGSTVIYQEFNGIEGLQLSPGGLGVIDRNGDVSRDLNGGDAGAYYEAYDMDWPCPNGDHIVYASNMPALF